MPEHQRIWMVSTRSYALEEEARKEPNSFSAFNEPVRRMLDASSGRYGSLDGQHLKGFLRGMMEGMTLDATTRSGEPDSKVELNGVPKGIRTPVLTVKG